MSDPRNTFTIAAAAFGTALGDVGDHDWDRPGLGEWDVRSLVGHTARALPTVEEYLASGSGTAQITDPADYFHTMFGDPADIEHRTHLDAGIAQRGRQAGTDLGPQPARHVADLAERVIALVHATPLGAPVASPAGTMTLEAYLPTRTFELTVHTLDLCRALGTTPPTELAPAIAETWDLLGRIAVRQHDQADLLLLATGRPRPGT